MPAAEHPAILAGFAAPANNPVALLVGATPNTSVIGHHFGLHLDTLCGNGLVRNIADPAVTVTLTRQRTDYRISRVVYMPSNLHIQISPPLSPEAKSVVKSFVAFRVSIKT